jgi:hypothetical protein
MEDFKQLAEIDGITVEGKLGKADNTNSRFRFSADGVSMELTRDMLYQVVMLYGLPKQKEDLVVVSNKKMRTVRRQLNIKAKKDIKEGEVITVEIDFPVEESIADKIESFKINK